MDSHLSEEALWASGLGARLKLIQGNCADEAPARRQQFISEEIELALKTVPPSRRKEFLAALQERFPSWQTPVVVTAPVSASATPAGAGRPAVPETPEALVEKLAAAAGALTAEKKAELAARLQQAGLAVASEGGADGLINLAPDFQRKLGVPPGRQLSVERAVKLLASMTEVMAALDQFAWKIWKEVAPKSLLRRDAELMKLAGPYLAGDPDVSTQQLVQALEKTRKILAAMMSAPAKTDADFAREHARRFAPDTLLEYAVMEKTIMGPKTEVLAWQKYELHFREHGNADAIMRQLREIFAKTVETLAGGPSANPRG